MTTLCRTFSASSKPHSIPMLDGHEVKIEQRPASCCHSHSDTWVVCLCGWEQNCRMTIGEAGQAIIRHRLSAIETVLNRSEQQARQIGEQG
jgi:hypothetical protein